MTGALIIAAIFEAAGALLAGGDVVATVARDLLTVPEMESSAFIMVMMSALLASALWVNVATYIGAPVSTTHAVVGGVVGAGIISAGFSVVAWPMIGTLATASGTLYIERSSRRDALRMVRSMQEALERGEVLSVFPEGTTGDGREMLPFQANL